ncbi:hypothetical protein OLMES_1588 [Oleiphilus messinensis]|uniref:Uncharacterized protein n=1 Tax=Oleiphilus messinensis TaxID=141451 RepID=A0A1Y0I8E0_9GAMM|nr:hypothetical protein OLMES_1588 [Oleiphilus messinensis]
MCKVDVEYRKHNASLLKTQLNKAYQHHNERAYTGSNGALMNSISRLGRRAGIDIVPLWIA